MNQGSPFRSFPALILTAGLFIASAGASLSARQEKSGTGEVTETKTSNGGEKADTLTSAAK